MVKKLFQGIQVPLFLSLFVLFTLNSCTEDHYYETDPSAYWDAFNLTVQNGHWGWDNSSECYFYEFVDDRISKYVVTDGVVDVKIVVDGVYKPLEYTAYYYQETGPGTGYFYSETINCEYRQGAIRFNVRASDLFDGTELTYQPKTYNFRVVLIW